MLLGDVLHMGEVRSESHGLWIDRMADNELNGWLIRYPTNPMSDEWIQRIPRQIFGESNKLLLLTHSVLHSRRSYKKKINKKISIYKYL
jgi:predicted alpha/beta hydrolase family esterase